MSTSPPQPNISRPAVWFPLMLNEVPNLSIVHNCHWSKLVKISKINKENNLCYRWLEIQSNFANVRQVGYSFSLAITVYYDGEKVYVLENIIHLLLAIPIKIINFSIFQEKDVFLSLLISKFEFNVKLWKKYVDVCIYSVW